MKKLLGFIGWHESRGDYNAVWGGISKKDRPPRPLTRMTIGEVLAWQDSIDQLYRSEAAGVYQILEDTLADIYRPAGFSLSDMFDENTQDALAIHLMRRRGLDKFRSGQMSAEKFANNLAKEWASLPLVSGPKRGRSYYAGDGLNKAGADPDEFLSVVEASRVVTIPQPPAPDGFETIISRIIEAIMRWFK